MASSGVPQTPAAASDTDDEAYDPLDDTGVTNPNIQGGHARAEWRRAHGR
jgi:hypothetical protein